mmetsp:Transcript_48469/g.152005  ORF Transcript_48469/g.152005 Transcript_48469/m.152005 type:complete len:529 (+) Transcript_48469:1341-2927(+)
MDGELVHSDAELHRRVRRLDPESDGVVALPDLRRLHFLHVCDGSERILSDQNDGRVHAEETILEGVLKLDRQGEVLSADDAVWQPLDQARVRVELVGLELEGRAMEQIILQHEVQRDLDCLLGEEYDLMGVDDAGMEVYSAHPMIQRQILLFNLTVQELHVAHKDLDICHLLRGAHVPILVAQSNQEGNVLANSRRDLPGDHTLVDADDVGDDVEQVVVLGPESDGSIHGKGEASLTSDGLGGRHLVRPMTRAGHLVVRPLLSSLFGGGNQFKDLNLVLYVVPEVVPCILDDHLKLVLLACCTHDPRRRHDRHALVQRHLGRDDIDGPCSLCHVFPVHQHLNFGVLVLAVSVLGGSVGDKPLKLVDAEPGRLQGQLSTDHLLPEAGPVLDHCDNVFGPGPGVSEAIKEFDGQRGRSSCDHRPVHVAVGGDVEAVDARDEADLAVGGVDFSWEHFHLGGALHGLAVDPDVNDAAPDLSLRPRHVVAAVPEVLHVGVLYLNPVSSLELLVASAIETIQPKVNRNAGHCLP